MSADVYSMIQTEREAFAGYLTTLSPEDWEKPSLCKGLRVKDVVAHVVAGAKTTPPTFLVGMVSAGFNFHKMTANALAKEVNAPTEALTEQVKLTAGNRTKPATTMLGEIVVHGEDVRKALGAPYADHAPEALILIADQYRKSPAPISGKKRVAGLRLESTDIPWAGGDGPVVSGPLMSLVMAISGRSAGLEQLTGLGCEELTKRIG